MKVEYIDLPRVSIVITVLDKFEIDDDGTFGPEVFSDYIFKLNNISIPEEGTSIEVYQTICSRFEIFIWNTPNRKRKPYSLVRYSKRDKRTGKRRWLENIELDTLTEIGLKITRWHKEGKIPE